MATALVPVPLRLGPCARKMDEWKPCHVEHFGVYDHLLQLFVVNTITLGCPRYVSDPVVVIPANVLVDSIMLQKALRYSYETRCLLGTTEGFWDARRVMKAVGVEREDEITRVQNRGAE